MKRKDCKCKNSDDKIDKILLTCGDCARLDVDAACIGCFAKDSAVHGRKICSGFIDKEGMLVTERDNNPWKYELIEKELFHIHTRRCGHAEDIDDEVIVQKALAVGAERIVFTDHAPFPGNPFGNRMNFEQLEEYIDAINNLKIRYSDQIEVMCGLEVEYLPSFDQYIKSLRENTGIDILILGQHMYEIPGTIGEYSFTLEDKSKEHIFLAEAIIEGMNTGYFDVVAHPDRIFRRCEEWATECEQISRQIIESAMKNSIPLEKNYSSLKHKNHYKQEFWNLIGSVIKTVKGIDAHSLSDIDDWIENQGKSWL